MSTNKKDKRNKIQFLDGNFMDIQDIRYFGSAQQLREINLLLTDAQNHGLLAEVVSTAMDYHRTTPKSSPLQSIIIGYSEWVK